MLLNHQECCRYAAELFNLSHPVICSLGGWGGGGEECRDIVLFWLTGIKRVSICLQLRRRNWSKNCVSFLHSFNLSLDWRSLFGTWPKWCTLQRCVPYYINHVLFSLYSTHDLMLYYWFWVLKFIILGWYDLEETRLNEEELLKDEMVVHELAPPKVMKRISKPAGEDTTLWGRTIPVHPKTIEVPELRKVKKVTRKLVDADNLLPPPSALVILSFQPLFVACLVVNDNPNQKQIALIKGTSLSDLTH